MSIRNVDLNEKSDRLIVRDGGDEAEGMCLQEETAEEERAKLQWLRAAAKEGFDAIDRGDYTVLRSREELKQFLREIHEEVLAELAVQRPGA
jgi:hypothetical protein